MDKQEFTPIEQKNLLKRLKKSQEQELRPLVSEDLVAMYSVFKQKVNPQADVVYHPSCATDTSPSQAFPDSKVIYVDIDEKAMKVLQESGYDAHTASALEYNPGPVNILILLNPAISPDVPSSFVAQGGYVLCNDYHSTATSLRHNPDYQLAGVVVPTNDGFFMDTEHLDDYWKEIETDEEWKNARFTWGAENYEGAAQLIEKITGKQENVLNEFKKIREEELKKSPDISDFFMISIDGNQFPVDTTLPRKKGTVDDIFVFQKNTSLVSIQK